MSNTRKEGAGSLTWSERWMSFRPLLWVGVFVIALHNAEEALTLPAWLAAGLADAGPLPVPSLIRNLGTVQLRIALVLATVMPAVWVACCWRAPAGSLAIYSLMALYAVILLNAAVPHIAASLLLRGYTPGVVTAATINVPYVLLLFRRALGEAYVSGRGLAVAAAAGAALYLPALLALHGLAQLIMLAATAAD